MTDKKADKPEPQPIINDNDPIHEKVMRDIHARAVFGKSKYGTYLQAHSGRDALMDAYQEALDLCMYLRQAIDENNDD